MTAAERLVRVLAEKGLTCAAAESCTGGGVGHAITAVAGASAVFLGGVVSYDNSVKHRVLGVPEEVLSSEGAVSSGCAAFMAEGARHLLKADIAVSVTGIAGPGGGSDDKPVGLVWFGLSSALGITTESMVFRGGRDEVRASAVDHALGLLLSAASA